MLAFAALVGAGSAAAAHDSLLKSTPTDGAVLPAPPTAITLKFSNDQLDGAAKLAATSDSGQVSQLENVTVTGPTVSATWPTNLPAGTYRVAWRSAGSDGHVLTGEFGFRYVTPHTGPTAPAATGSPDVSILVTPEPTQTQSTGGFPWWIIGVIVVVGAGIITVVIVRGKDKNGTS